MHSVVIALSQRYGSLSLKALEVVCCRIMKRQDFDLQSESWLSSCPRAWPCSCGKLSSFGVFEPWEMLFLRFSNSMLAALLAKVVANLKERRDFAGEDVIDVERIAAAQIGHAHDLSVGAALRDGPVVVRGEPVSPTPYVIKALAGAAFNNNGVIGLLYNLPSDHDA
jgi:hypothetical protein